MRSFRGVVRVLIARWRPLTLRVITKRQREALCTTGGTVEDKAERKLKQKLREWAEQSEFREKR